jgi:hypothetical protein
LRSRHARIASLVAKGPHHTAGPAALTLLRTAWSYSCARGPSPPEADHGIMISEGKAAPTAEDTAMTQQPPPVEADRPTVGSYDRYPRAQRAVDFLSDNNFPVKRTAITGSDLRMVETVLGRLTRARAALAGAGTGAWFGLLVGLLLSVFASSQSSPLVLLSGLAYGALFGALFGFIAHPVAGGTSLHEARSWPPRYDVVADAHVADEAKNLLINWPGERAADSQAPG